MPSRDDTKTNAVPPAESVAAGPPSLDGRYDLVRLLGKGGMGGVWKARDGHLGRDLAVKVLLERYADHPRITQRFLDEARIHSRLQHPGIAPLYDLGRTPEGRPFFTMKLIEGQTLAELLQQRASPTENLPRFVQVFAHVCQAVAYAHSQGIIHRDLKPQNVMVGPFGEVLVMDWGLAKDLSPDRAHDGGDWPVALDDDPDATRTGDVLGTLAYMPPEQARGQIDRVDRRSDVFALGGLLCVILTGDPPYAGDSLAEVEFLASAGDLYEAFEKLAVCDADPELVMLARQCLAPAREDRPPDAGEVSRRAETYLEGVQEKLRLAELDRERAEVRAAEERKRRRWQFGLAASVILLAGSSLAGGLWWEAERDARRRDVGTALDEARALMRRADWPEARAVLQQAAGRLGGYGPDDLRGRLAAARTDLEIVAELDEARMVRSSFVNGMPDHRLSARAYAGAFLKAGLDLDSRPETAARRFRDSPIRERLVAGLEDWAFCLHHTGDAGARDRLLGLAREADPGDGPRASLRDPSVWADAGALDSLAGRLDAAELPPSTVTVLASLLAFQDREDAAARLMRTAQARHPEDFWLNLALGNILLESRPAGAVEFYRAAIALRPDNSTTYGNLSYACRLAHRPEEALAAAAKSVELDPESGGAHCDLACALLELGRPAEALELARRGAELAPDHSAVQTSLCWALLDTGHPEEALAAGRRAVELDPANAHARVNIAVALCDLGRYEEALPYCREAIRMMGHRFPYPYGQLCFVLNRLGRTEEAITAGRAAVDVDPDYAMGRANLAAALAADGRTDEAIEQARKAIELKPDLIPARLTLAETLPGRGRLDEAIQFCHEVIELDPDSPSPHGMLCWLLRTRGRLDQAIAAGEKAVAMSPGDGGFRGNLASALLQAGRPDDALPHARLAVEYRPDDPTVHVCLCWALIETGDFAEAVRTGTRAAELDPADPWAFNNLGFALYSTGDFEGATLAYCRAVALGPATELHWVNLGNALLEDERAAGAAAAYSGAIRLNPADPFPHAKLGDALGRAGRHGEAVTSCERAVALAPDDASMRAVLAAAHFRRGDLDAAEQALVESIERDASLPGPALLLQTCRRLRTLESQLPAILAGERATDTEDLLDLAELLAEVRHRPGEAVRLYEAAFRANPEVADDPERGLRVAAASAAVTAALAETDPAPLLARAREWLGDELDAWAAGLESGSVEPGEMCAALRGWHDVPAFDAVRYPSLAAGLPAAERLAWRAFWSAVDDRLGRLSRPGIGTNSDGGETTPCS